jgi:hypothetical protein
MEAITAVGILLAGLILRDAIHALAFVTLPVAIHHG